MSKPNKLKQILNVIKSIIIAKLTQGVDLFGTVITAALVHLYINQNTVSLSNKIVKKEIRKEISPINKNLFGNLLTIITFSLLFFYIGGLFFVNDKISFFHSLKVIPFMYIFTLIAHLELSRRFKYLNKLEELHFTFFDFIKTIDGIICFTVFLLYSRVLWYSLSLIPKLYQISVIVYIPIFSLYFLTIFCIENKKHTQITNK